MSTYDASASFSLRSSLPALRNTLAIPPSPSAARFFCSSTRDVTFCLIPPNNPEAAAPPFPALAAEPLPVLIGRSVCSPTKPAPVLEVLLLLFVGMLPLHRRVRARRGPVETAGTRACPAEASGEGGTREPGSGRNGAYFGTAISYRTTVTVTCPSAVSAPSSARERSTYVPGSLKVACTATRPSGGIGGGTHTGAHGEF